MVALTPGRRAELAALLDDEERLRVEYPQVSEYLGMAPRLAGTGDVRADAAFDLRFVHYVTGGWAESSNPYWDVVAPAVHVRDGRRVVDGGNPGGSARLGYAQMLLQGMYAYAVPSPETVGWVSRFCGGWGVVELGAGRGYWAGLLEKSGVPVEAYDFEPPQQGENVSFPRAGKQVDVWRHVGDLEEFGRNGGFRADRVLFLCWPPGWGNSMAADALAAFEGVGGERLVFVGQPRGGMTATDGFFDALAAGWELVDADDQHVSWWNTPDVVQGWVRR